MAAEAGIDIAEILFEPVLDEYLLVKGLVQRDWLLRAVEEFLACSELRFLVIEGGPGTGKSTFAAALARRLTLAPRYFVRKDAQTPLASADGRTFLFRIGRQIAILRPGLMDPRLDVRSEIRIDRMSEDADVIGVDVERMLVGAFQETALRSRHEIGEARGRVVGIRIGELTADPSRLSMAALTRQALVSPALELARQAPQDMIVLLVDGLDEIGLATGWTMGEASIVDWLADCERLPLNVRVISTTRPRNESLSVFYRRQDRQTTRLRLESEPRRIEAEITEYAEALLRDTGLGARPGLAEAVAGKADTVFLYVALWGQSLRRALESGDTQARDALLDQAVLPAGLDDLYQHLIDQARRALQRRVAGTHAGDARWKAHYQPLLALLAVAFTALPGERLAHYLALPDAAERILAPVLADLGPLLRTDRSTVRLCHASLASFLSDDGIVDPGVDHLRLARRLISLYSYDWSRCEDTYALNYTARHLIAALETGEPDEASVVPLLLDLLGAADYGLAKSLARGVGFRSLVADGVAAWHLLGRLRPERQEELAIGLARVALALDQRPGQDGHEALSTTLAYRVDGQDLHAKVLDILGNPDFLRTHAEPGRVNTLVLTAAHAEAARIRRLGGAENIARAGEILRHVLDSATSHEPEPDNLGAIYYEFAYVQYLQGDFQSASAWFDRSIRVAERRGNPSAVYAATAPLRRAEFYTGALNASAYRAFLDEELRDLSRLAATGFDPEIFRLIMTANFHLLDLAVATADAALAESQLAVLENDPWLREFGRTDARTTEDMITKVRARTALVRRTWQLAICYYEDLLAADLAGSPSHREELARDLHDYARALVGANRTSDARQTLELAWEIPDQTGAWLWKPHIRKLRELLNQP